MRVYVGEQDELSGRCRVWIVHEEPRPEISEVVEVLGDLNKFMEFRRDGSVDDDYEHHRAETIARKNAIVEQLRAAETAPRPSELRARGIHSANGFEWGHCGDGPADLAYSILLTEIGELPTPPVYMQFRDDVIARYASRSFRLPAQVVWEWIEANRSLVEAELFEKIPAPTDGTEPVFAVTESDSAIPASPINEASGSAVVRACEQAWEDIQEHHPELPNVVVVLGTGVERGRLVKLGHWWGGRWIADGQARGEVLLAGEALHLPPAQVFEVLLHEAAHGLNAARRIPDTSRGGRYHNRRFAVTANEVLLDVQLMPPYGFAKTELTAEAEERYAPTIERLGEAMRIARQIARGVKVGVEAEGQLGGGREAETGGRDGRRKDAITAMCGCGRRLRMAPSIYEQGPVVCGLCGSAFRDGAEQRTEPELGEQVIDGTFLERRRAELDAEGSTHHLVSPRVLAIIEHQRAQLAAALVAATDGPGVFPLRARLDAIEQMLEANGVRSTAEVPTPTPLQIEGVRELVESELDPADASVAARWYEAYGTPHERPMVAGASPRSRTDLAQSLLKADGTLRGPSAEAGDHEVLVGDRVISTRDVPALDLPAGIPGTVEEIDAATQDVRVDFATWGRLEISVARMLDVGIAHDYVATDGSAASQEVDLAESLAIEANRIEPGTAW
ncbi:MAG: hypothetical protein V7636_2200 [Actinomycetota bacterium]